MNEHIKNLLISEVSSLDGDVALYVKFLNTNQEVAINETSQFWAASLVKVFIASYFYDQVNQNKIDPNIWITVKKENNVLGSGIAHLLDSETKYLISDLVVLMLTLSDNSATNEIIDLLGFENIENYILKIGLKNTTLKHKLLIPAGKGPNLTTAQDMGFLLELLYKSKLPYSDKILNIMNEAKDRDRIPLLIPNEIKIPHKYGSLPEAMHDIGIIYAKEPFIFVFLSDNQKDKLKTNKILSECAKICFDFVQI